MEYLERNPLPEECQSCTDPQCDVCDIGLDRWYIPNELELRLQKKSLLKALARGKQNSNATGWIEKRIEEINQKLLPFTEAQLDAIEHRTDMSKTIFDECIQVCLIGHDEEMRNALLRYYPAYAY